METITNVNNKTMRTKEELLKAVNLSLDDDNKRTPLTTQLYQVIYASDRFNDTQACHSYMCGMYKENELQYNKYNNQRKELKYNQNITPLSKIDFDATLSYYNKMLATLRMRRKVLGFVLGEVSIEVLIGSKKYHEREFYNNI